MPYNNEDIYQFIERENLIETPTIELPILTDQAKISIPLKLGMLAMCLFANDVIVTKQSKIPYEIIEPINQSDSYKSIIKYEGADMEYWSDIHTAISVTHEFEESLVEDDVPIEDLIELNNIYMEKMTPYYNKRKRRLVI
ncbi:MAG: hypothetical protein R3E32_23965 [Chitinophagales bacterium]